MTVCTHIVDCLIVDRCSVEPGSSTLLLSTKTEDRNKQEQSCSKTEVPEDRGEEDLLR